MVVFVDPLKREFLADAERYGELSGFVGLCPMVQLVTTLVTFSVQATGLHHWVDETRS
jgi:hypothetical protein